MEGDIPEHQLGTESSADHSYTVDPLLAPPSLPPRLISSLHHSVLHPPSSLTSPLYSTSFQSSSHRSLIPIIPVIPFLLPSTTSSSLSQVYHIFIMFIVSHIRPKHVLSKKKRKNIENLKDKKKKLKMPIYMAGIETVRCRK